MRWKRWQGRQQKKDRRFVDMLLSGVRRFLAVVGDWWKRRTTPPGPGRYTDQW